MDPTVAFFVGALGDGFLQLFNKTIFPDIAGLDGYFKKHGSLEAMTIAGGMMFFFAIVYKTFKLPNIIWVVALYGIVWDLIFRLGRLYPSLDGYYKKMNYFHSALWGAIPMLMVYFVTQAIA